MGNKIDWKTYLGVAIVLLIIYAFVKQMIDPTPCYPGDVIEYNDGRSSATCQTTIEEYDKWARKHMPCDEYLQFRKDEDLDDDD